MFCTIVMLSWYDLQISNKMKMNKNRRDSKFTLVSCFFFFFYQTGIWSTSPYLYVCMFELGRYNVYPLYIYYCDFSCKDFHRLRMAAFTSIYPHVDSIRSILFAMKKKHKNYFSLCF